MYIGSASLQPDFPLAPVYLLKQIPFPRYAAFFVSNTLKYKGFLGSVAFSEADNVFFGKIEGIDGLVNFEGESVKELTDAFHEAVDDYLAYCEEEGIEPHKSYSGTFNVRLSPDLHSRIAYLAKQTGVSINSFIRTAVEKQISAML